MLLKRLFDLSIALPAAMLLSPLLLLFAIWVKLDSPGPAFFFQQRIGRYGKPFNIIKFRTMVSNAPAQGAQITVGQDKRITRSGAFIRKYKLDELPQLLNVIKGDMSLVGPRPEVPQYVELWPQAVRDKVLSVPPGITDFAAIEFRDEAALLEKAADPLKTYVEEITPIKLDYYQRYVQSRSLWMDFRILLLTVKAVISH